MTIGQRALFAGIALAMTVVIRALYSFRSSRAVLTDGAVHASSSFPVSSNVFRPLTVQAEPPSAPIASKPRARLHEQLDQPTVDVPRVERVATAFDELALAI